VFSTGSSVAAASFTPDGAPRVIAWLGADSSRTATNNAATAASEGSFRMTTSIPQVGGAGGFPTTWILPCGSRKAHGQVVHPTFSSHSAGYPGGRILRAPGRRAPGTRRLLFAPAGRVIEAAWPSK